MNLHAQLALTLDQLSGAEQAERCAEILRTMAESFPLSSQYRAYLETTASDFESDARIDRGIEAEEHALRRARKAVAEGTATWFQREMVRMG